MHTGDEKDILTMSLRFFFKKFSEGILHKVAHIPELWMSFEELLSLLQNFLIYSKSFRNLSQSVLHLTYYMRKYYIYLSLT